MSFFLESSKTELSMWYTRVMVHRTCYKAPNKFQDHLAIVVHSSSSIPFIIDRKDEKRFLNQCVPALNVLFKVKMKFLFLQILPVLDESNFFKLKSVYAVYPLLLLLPFLTLVFLVLPCFLLFVLFPLDPSFSPLLLFLSPFSSCSFFFLVPQFLLFPFSLCSPVPLILLSPCFSYFPVSLFLFFHFSFSSFSLCSKFLCLACFSLLPCPFYSSFALSSLHPPLSSLVLPFSPVLLVPLLLLFPLCPAPLLTHLFVARLLLCPVFPCFPVPLVPHVTQFLLFFIFPFFAMFPCLLFLGDFCRNSIET